MVRAFHNGVSENFWETERIRLRAVEPSDAAIFYEWNQHSNMPRHLDMVWFPSSLAGVEQWARETSLKSAENDSQFLIIEDDAGNVVGFIHPNSCDRKVGNFAYGVGVRPNFQRHGYAAQAVRLLLRYFFNELNYQKCTLNIHSNNAESIALHEKLGFTPEGRLRRVVYSAGAFHDLLYYGITREEFEVKNGFPPSRE